LYDLLNEEVADCVASYPHHFTTKASKCVMKLRLILIGHQIWPRVRRVAKRTVGQGQSTVGRLVYKSSSRVKSIPHCCPLIVQP
jgi:hypothetical protein